MGDRLAQIFWCLIASAILGATLWLCGVPVPWPWAIAGGVFAIGGAVLAIAPMNRERWEAMWDLVGGAISSLVWWWR